MNNGTHRNSPNDRRRPDQRDPRDLEPRERETRGSDPRNRQYGNYREREHRGRHSNGTTGNYSSYGNYPNSNSNSSYSNSYSSNSHSNNSYSNNSSYSTSNYSNYSNGRGPRNDRHRPNDRYRQDRGREQRAAPAEKSVDPDAKLTPEEIIKKYERTLASLLNVPTIEKLPVVGSQWGIKPKGFESVTAQRAKLSGLFPLPGSPRPVDPTKLEGLLSENGVLLATSKIDPSDSRNSCILVVQGIDFSKVDFLGVAEYIDQFLRSADVEGLSLSNNIERKRKTKDDQKLIIEFKSNVAATLALALDGRVVPSSFVTQFDSADSEVRLSISRPGEYVVQCLPPYKAKSEDVEETVVDSPRKLTLQFDPQVTESALTEQLTQVAPLRAFKYLREVGTKEPLGIAFAEFYVDPTKFPNTKSALNQTMEYLSQVQSLESITSAQFSCITVSDGTILTSIQDCPIELKTLRALVRNEYVPFHPKSKVIQLINAVTAADLVDEASFRFIEQDILQEARNFGNVVSIKIPRPPHDYSPGISQLTQPGIGKIYIEFDDEKTALNTLMGMAGRCYNDRTVLCAFYSHDDYANGLF